MFLKKNYLVFTLTLSIIVIPFLSSSQENTFRNDLIWTGNNSEDWDEPLNWSPNQVPDENSNITIPASPSGSLFPVISGELFAECNDLTIEPGSSLSLRGFLTVYSNLNNTDESALAILSDASGTGSLIFESGNIYATVNRYLSDFTSHFIGPSVNGATLNDLFFNNDPEVFLYQYDESSSEWINISDLDTPLVQGAGYSVQVAGSENRENVTAQFKGSLRSTDLVLSGNSLTYTETSEFPGYNLISNPFSSALSWDLGNWQTENISGCIWLWNGSYNYLFRNAHGMGSLEKGIVPASQAFTVKATGHNPVLILSANDRVHSAQNFYKYKTESDSVSYVVLELKKGYKTDEVWVSFCDECTNGNDYGWDTEKLYGKIDAPQLFFVENEKELSIVALPPLGEETRTFPLNFMAGESGQHTITLSEVENGDMEGVRVLLKDLFGNKEQILTINPTYHFQADTSEPANRFEIEIREGPNSIDSPKNRNDYLIYSFENNIKIKPLHASSNENYTIQIIDFSGKIIRELEASSDSETNISLNPGNPYVIVRLITDKSVIIKKLLL